jgi:DNA processing protein
MKRRALTDAERIAWLRLARTPSVGPVTFAGLIARFGDAGAALDALPGLVRRGGGSAPLRIPSHADAEREIAMMERMRGRLIAWCEPDFPSALAALDPPPAVIAVIGAPDLLTKPCVAIVGARNASAAGLRMASTLARELGAAGYVVVSGLARGIDGAAHQASLDSGTVAVVAGGPDHIYPPEHEALYRDIATRGAIVSENAPGYRATARDFPRRNRLVSGLSLGVVVVEAAQKSGTLITARLAGEQGREVMAVPGSPLDPRAKGTNRLLRDGAALVETAQDVIETLGSARRILSAPENGDAYAPLAVTEDEEADAVRDRILELLSPTPVARDELARLAGARPAAALAALIELELAGRAVLLPGGFAVLAIAPD